MRAISVATKGVLRAAKSLALATKGLLSKWLRVEIEIIKLSSKITRDIFLTSFRTGEINKTSEILNEFSTSSISMQGANFSSSVALSVKKDSTLAKIMKFESEFETEEVEQ